MEAFPTRHTGLGAGDTCWVGQPLLLAFVSSQEQTVAGLKEEEDAAERE